MVLNCLMLRSQIDKVLLLGLHSIPQTQPDGFRWGIKNMLWGCHCCDSYLSLPKNDEFGGDSCPWSIVLALPQEQLWWKKALSEKHQKLKWHWDAPPCMVLGCGPQGCQRYRLPSLNQKTFGLFLAEKNWLNLPHSSFPFCKGKEALNF